MDAAARTAHDSTLQPFSEMEHYKHADELPPEIMADSYDKLERLCLKYMNEDDFSRWSRPTALLPRSIATKSGASGEMYINHPVEGLPSFWPISRWTAMWCAPRCCTIPSRILRPRSPMFPACLAIRWPSS